MSSDVVYRAPQVCALAGVTYRQIDYWCRTGLLRPPVAARGSGSQRLFDVREAQVAWTLGRLSSLGPGFLVELGCLRDLDEWRGWLLVEPSGCAVVDAVADLPGDRTIVTLLNLGACPIGAPAREEAVA